jgi:hypothetical protein
MNLRNILTLMDDGDVLTNKEINFAISRITLILKTIGFNGYAPYLLIYLWFWI